MSPRSEFKSKLGFILAASGSAIGLGNIWGFPVQVAENGGGAFVASYLALTFLLAYPVLMAELVIGRYARANTVSGMLAISGNATRLIAIVTGYWGIVTASLILSFYAIVAGWMFAYGAAAIFQLAGLAELAQWMRDFSVSRNIIFCAIFMLFTCLIVRSGVSDGIERWSSWLMPALIALIIALIVYIATLEGAAQGWQVYMQPDFARSLQPEVMFDALGQAFFSLSLGVGTMMIYGSYVSKNENLPRLGVGIVLMDIAIAILAGMLIIPAMYAAAHSGVEIYNASGSLVNSDGLIFAVLPALFDNLGTVGIVVSAFFFVMMSLAALTSSISMLEVPVAYFHEQQSMSRRLAVSVSAIIIFIISLLIIANFDQFFGMVISFTTRYSEPLIGLLYCLFVGWVWHRNKVLQELKCGNPALEQGLFWKLWPSYVKYVCPLLILLVLWQSVA